jgi:hypothetical protein
MEDPLPTPATAESTYYFVAAPRFAEGFPAKIKAPDIVEPDN